MNFTKISQYLDSLEEMGTPSVDCIIYKDHEQVYRHMNGTVDEKRTVPVTEKQQYLMFSMTKIQTMTAIMQLVEKGLISLEDEVGDYLPAYKNLMVKETIDGKEVVRPAKTPLKLKYLLSMQSGLDYDLERPGIKRVLQEKGMKATTRELVDAFVESPLLFDPGTRFNYSLSHDVAAAIIEVVAGMSFSEYLKKNIWEPLKMTRTFFAKPMNDNVENLAKQFIYNDPDGSITPMESSCCYQLSDCYESGGAGLISCTEDYSLLGEALANGGISKDGVRILKPETIEIIKENLLGEESLKDIANNMGRPQYGYGCGMQVFMKPELSNSPAPVGVFGWDGAAGSCLIMDTKNKVSLTFTMHVRGCGPAYGVIHPKLRDMLFED